MNDHDKPLPPLPTFDMARIHALRRRIVDEAGFAYLEDSLESDSFQAFVDAVAALLPASVARPVVFDSCRSVLGRPLTRRRLETLAWRLAGNVSRMQRDIPIYPWSQQDADEWVPVHVVSGEYTTTRRGDLACEYGFRVLAGTSAPLLFKQTLTRKHCNVLASRLGFSRSRKRGKLPFRDSYQLVNLKLCVLVEMELSKNRPGFYHMAVPPVFQSQNIQLLKKRYRVGWECPRDYHHPCHKCVVGYKDCEAATHRDTHILKNCYHCLREDARFDPERSTEMCIACYIKDKKGYGN